MEQFDLNQVLVFTKVVEAGSLTRAAQALGMPKSTVSRRLSELEERLGARLIERTTRRLRLTDLGAGYFERCAKFVRELQEAEREVSEAQATPRGSLRITAPVDFGSELLGLLIAEFRDQYPEVTVMATLTGRLVDLVAEGFDVALRAGSLPDSSLVARRLIVDSRKLYASPAYLKRAGTPRSIEELAQHDLVLFGSRATSRWQLHGDGRSQEIAVSGEIVADEFGFVRNAVLAGAGIGYMPTLFCMRDLSQGRLVPVLEQYSSEPDGIYAVYPSGVHLPAKTRAFIDFTAKRMGSLVVQCHEYLAQGRACAE